MSKASKSNKVEDFVGYQLGRLLFKLDGFKVIDAYSRKEKETVIVDLSSLSWNSIGDLADILSDAYADFAENEDDDGDAEATK